MGVPSQDKHIARIPLVRQPDKTYEELDERHFKTIPGLRIPPHDYLEIEYDGSNKMIKITYKDGGAGGEIVAVIDITYGANDKIATVTITLS